MTKYEYYTQQKERCEEMARKYINDFFLYVFYRNAAKGYAIKRNKLTLQEAAE